MSRQDELENRITHTVQQLEREFTDVENLRWAIARGLIHRAVHHAAEKPGVEFCALASYLAEMVAHAHKLMHGDNPKATSHKDLVH
jgi:hypothetical protein